MKTSAHWFLLALLSWAMMPFGIGSAARAQSFTLVIDPGHGGHDPGAVGRKAREKDINLSVALKLGRMVQEECPDVNVIYTRSSDVFIPLNRRAEIANNAKADLFVSIHTNSVAGNNRAVGASTWTLGLAKSDANLAVAKRENAVILYEDDYKTSYAGFDPNSSESYIIFEFMQDNYMSQSVHLASLVQQEFKTTCRRSDQGVHQAGFLVLKASAMPSILVELGFISTPAEEQFLASDAGATTMATGIFRAFCTYKAEQQARAGNAAATSTNAPPTSTARGATSTGHKMTSQDDPATSTGHETTSQDGPATSAGHKTTSQDDPATSMGHKTTSPDEEATVFKVQFLTSAKRLAANDRRLSGLRQVDCYVENNVYKYTCGATADYDSARALLRQVTKRYKDAFIVAFRGGRKVGVGEAINTSRTNK